MTPDEIEKWHAEGQLPQDPQSPAPETPSDISFPKDQKPNKKFNIKRVVITVVFIVLILAIVSGIYLLHAIFSVESPNWELPPDYQLSPTPASPASVMQEFDPENSIRITIRDAVTHEGIRDVPINFLYDCPGSLTNDSTCGGKYEPVLNGKTDENGIYIVQITSKTAPPGILDFVLGDVNGYNTDIGTGTFLWGEGPQNDVVYHIMPNEKRPGLTVYSKESAIAEAEKDERVISWKASMEKTYPNADVRAGFWRVYYQGTKGNQGDSNITLYVEPSSGRVVLFRELIYDYKNKPDINVNPWPTEEYTKGKILIGFRGDYEYEKAQTDVMTFGLTLEGTNYYWEYFPQTKYIQRSDVFAVDVPEGQEEEFAQKLYNEVTFIDSASVCPITFCNK